MFVDITKKMLVIVLSAMWIFDVKAMTAQKILIVHCCKQHEKNTSDGFEINVFFSPPSFDMWKG
jgi:hypothetical protein